jgi:hypothetical protein
MTETKVNYTAFLEPSQPLKELYSSTDSITKDKVISVRMEQGLYSMLEALAETLNTGTTANTVRTILTMFFLPVVYEFEFENMKPEKLSQYVKRMSEKGEPVNFDRFQLFIQELEKYNSFLTEAQERGSASMEFIAEQKTKVERSAALLRKAEETWRELLVEEKNKK